VVELQHDCRGDQPEHPEQQLEPPEASEGGSAAVSAQRWSSPAMVEFA
jgi:hypothetical protein